MLARPFSDKFLGTPWKIAFDHFQGVDGEHPVVLF